MKSYIKRFCNTVAPLLALVLFLGAVGGCEAGNYGIISMLIRMAADACVVLTLLFIGL